MAIEVTETTFTEEVTNSPKPVVVDFYATWCGPCKQLAPIIDTLSKENPEVKFVKVDIDKARDLAIKHGVTSIPTLVFFKDGKPASKEVGFKSQEELQEIVNNLK